MCISDPIRTVQSTIHNCKVTNKPGDIVLCDFEKAFGSVSHDYIKEMVHSMNISAKDAEGQYEGFIRWTALAFTNTEAKCIINGRHSPGLKLSGGGRQGDNLFPLLFAIVVHGLKVLTDVSTLQGICLGEPWPCRTSSFNGACRGQLATSGP